MGIRKLSRKIKCKPLLRLKKKLLEVIYLATGNAGSFWFGLLQNLKLMAEPPAFDASRVKKILVIRPDRIGDLILSTPVLYALRQRFPDGHITLLVQEQNKDLVFANPHISDLLTINGRGMKVILKGGPVNRLRQEKFDLAVVLYPSFWSCLLAFLSRSPSRLGYDFHGSGFLLTLKLPYTYDKIIKHEVDVNLALLGLIGIVPEKKELQVSVDLSAEKRVERFLELYEVLAQDRVAVIHPGAYEEYIRWKTSGFARVADILISEDKMKVIILGGPGEEGIVSLMVSLMDNRPIIACGFKLSETISLIKRSALFIGNSTGPMHIAAALKIPVVAIFGNSHPLDCYQKWGPYGTRSTVVQRDGGGNRRREEIGADEVIMAARRLMAS